MELVLALLNIDIQHLINTKKWEKGEINRFIDLLTDYCNYVDLTNDNLLLCALPPTGNPTNEHVTNSIDKISTTKFQDDTKELLTRIVLNASECVGKGENIKNKIANGEKLNKNEESFMVNLNKYDSILCDKCLTMAQFTSNGRTYTDLGTPVYLHFPKTYFEDIKQLRAELVIELSSSDDKLNNTVASRLIGMNDDTFKSNIRSLLYDEAKARIKGFAKIDMDDRERNHNPLYQQEKRLRKKNFIVANEYFREKIDDWMSGRQDYQTFVFEFTLFLFYFVVFVLFYFVLNSSLSLTFLTFLTTYIIHFSEKCHHYCYLKMLQKKKFTLEY